jgi:uncharacterized caspase-like protein
LPDRVGDGVFMRVGRGLAVWIVLALAWALVPAATAAEAPAALRGVALVIGNGDYEHLPKLANPPVEDLLSKLGFDTSLASDRNAKRLARDLEDFVDDAEGADVAVLYYAGHGIEAGGENFLVPTDADIAALDDAGRRLVPLSRVVEELRRTVRVAIVLLDACRDNPFPPGASLRLEAGAGPVAVGATGLSLGATRGARSLVAPAAGDASLGTVIGFAAEPGRPALDGAPGANSPYAGSILKHLAAIDGAEFGTVMRMVAEEVYLRTDGRQHPWVNESLRRLLYFGGAPKPVEGEEGEILTERRQLLLTIASLDDAGRRQVELAAHDGGVPMDALYGMLNVLGADAPKDRERLDAVLRAQTARLKDILAERAALVSPDPEIARLSGLADKALADGALATAIRLQEQAKARVRQGAAALDQAAAQLSARFVEAAAVYARSAATYEVAYDYRKAAADYGEAFRLVERWDRALAWKYKNSEAAALAYYGQDAGDIPTLERAAGAARAAAALVTPDASPSEWAASQDNLASALRQVAVRRGDAKTMAEAADILAGAAALFSRGRDPLRWARLQNDLAAAQRDLAFMNGDTAGLMGALETMAAAAAEFSRDRDAAEWARVRNNLGNALTAAGIRAPDPAGLYRRAVQAYGEALEEIAPDRDPTAWARVQANLGDVLYRLGKATDDTAALRRSAKAFAAVIDAGVRPLAPLQWAKAQLGFADSLVLLDALAGRTGGLEPAVAAYRLSLEEYRRDVDPRRWALAQFGLGSALVTLGEAGAGTVRFEEAADAFRAAADEYAARNAPRDGIAVQYALAGALLAWAGRETGTQRLEEAVGLTAAALDAIRQSGWTPYEGPLLARRGNALAALAQRDPARRDDLARQAADAYRAAIPLLDRGGQTAGAARSRLDLGDLLLGAADPSADMLREARAAYAAARDYARSHGDRPLEAHLDGRIARADAALAGR